VVIKKVKGLREQFGKNLRKLRLAAGLTQEQLAEKSNISVDFLSLIERGRNSPSFDNLDSLASALQLQVSDLFVFEETEQ
jgi:transcriptional regulator with XRE-family HTH domain